MLYIVQYVLCILIRQLILQCATGLTPDSFLNCNIYHKITHRKDFPFYSIKSKRIAFVITSPTLSLRKNINYVRNYARVFFFSFSATTLSSHFRIIANIHLTCMFNFCDSLTSVLEALPSKFLIQYIA